jgi:hypothetical protein
MINIMKKLEILHIFDTISCSDMECKLFNKNPMKDFCNKHKYIRDLILKDDDNER